MALPLTVPTGPTRTSSGTRSRMLGQGGSRGRDPARRLRVLSSAGSNPNSHETQRAAKRDVKHQRKKHKQPRQTEQRGEVVLSLSDLAYGRSPWRLNKQADFREIGLERLLPSAVVEVDTSAADASECVGISLRVESVGDGYYVRGKATGRIALVCSACSSHYGCDVSAPFQVWLSRDGDQIDDIGPNEVPWPPYLRAVDLTEVVASAICDEVIECMECATCVSRETLQGVELAAAQEREHRGNDGRQPAGQFVFGDLVKLKETLGKSS